MERILYVCPALVTVNAVINSDCCERHPTSGAVGKRPQKLPFVAGENKPNPAAASLGFLSKPVHSTPVKSGQSAKIKVLLIMRRFVQKK